MTSFFPPFYKDELLYSALARYHQRSGNESCKETLKELIGKSTTSAISDFPGDIEVLCEKIGSTHSKPINLIYSHTLLPYYLPFISEEHGNKIRHQMINENSNAIYVGLGLAASRIKETNYFRFCASCFNEETAILGEAYWHRTHQLPGVFICSKHKEALIESHIPYRNKQNKHKFFTLNETSIKQGKLINIPELFFNKFLFIADQSYRLLNERELLTRVDNLQEYYLKKLQEKGYITKSKQIRMQELKSTFLNSFDTEFLRIVNSSFKLDDEDTWFHKVLRKPRVACHPLRHLLLLLFLNEAIPNNLIKDKLENYPFGKGPWPCLNKAANHYEELLITECVITTDSKTKQPVGTFSCNHCNFIYSRRGPDHCDKDKYKIGRVKNFGIVWINKLNELDSCGIFSTRKISLILGVDSKTIKTYLTNDKDIAEDKFKKIINERIIKEETAEKHKKNLLNLINDNPGFSRTELRKVNPSGYIWLYRNHREWLLKNLPNPKISHKTTAKINWDQRDKEYSFLLIKEAINILTEEPLIRLTKTRIAKRLDLQSRFEKNIDKLPICKSILDDVSEDTEDFQIRRIMLRAEGLRKRNFYYSKSTLVRAAGLGKNLSRKVNKILHEELGFLDNVHSN